MLEAAILVLIASGLWFFARRWNQNQVPSLSPSNEERRSLSILAQAGLYSLNSPQEKPRLAAFRDLHLIEGGLALVDNQSQQELMFDFAAIQWVSAINLPQEGIAEIAIHLELQQRWRILYLQMPEAEMSLLARVLRQIVPPARLNLGHPQVSPIGPLSARIAEDNLQGESILGAEISLYLLPQLLLVLKDDLVQAKLDTSSIRRVLAVEKLSGRLDSFINPKQNEGVIRLHSLYETVAFTLPQYRELAEEISFLAHCPLEFISQEDKTSKG